MVKEPPPARHAPVRPPAALRGSSQPRSPVSQWPVTAPAQQVRQMEILRVLMAAKLRQVTQLADMEALVPARFSDEATGWIGCRHTATSQVGHGGCAAHSRC